MGSRTKGDIILIEFDYTQDFDTIDYRKNPELYIIGRGEQGVLLCEPYKSEICKHWRFRTPQIAFDSANRIYAMFDDYLVRDEFVGADMARKFLMMGWTRARRYANHHTGKKYDDCNSLARHTTFVISLGLRLFRYFNLSLVLHAFRYSKLG